MLILAVDDNVEITLLVRAMVQRFFTPGGCEVLVGRDGREALAILKALDSIPDVIISNLRMPNMDGIALLHEVQQNELWTRTELILMTAAQVSEAHAAMVATGAGALLLKPFSYQDLAAVLEKLV